MKRVLETFCLYLASAALSGLAGAAELPLNPAVTQATVDETICVKGWTKSVRPPVSYTNSVKRELMERDGLPLELMADFVLDHRIPLALGGAPADWRNLILQDHDDSEAKDRVEVCLARAVCAEMIDLDVARRAIWTDWKSAGRLCGGKEAL